MRNVDWICLAILSIFSFVGLRRGLIGEFFRVISLIGGLLAGFTLAPFLTNLLESHIPPSTIKYAQILFFFVGCLTCIFAISSLGWIIQRILRLTILGWVDRAGGLLIGSVKGFLVIGLFIWLISFIPHLQTNFKMQDTIIARKAVKAVHGLWRLAPKDRWIKSSFWTMPNIEWLEETADKVKNFPQEPTKILEDMSSISADSILQNELWDSVSSIDLLKENTKP